MIAVDTNIVVRLIADDEPAQTRQVCKLFEHSSVLLLTGVLLEAVWVLQSAYGLSRRDAVVAIERLCGLPGVVLSEPNVVEAAIASYEFGIEFSDAVLLHSAAASGASAFITFDRDLIKRAPRAVTAIKVEAP